LHVGGNFRYGKPEDEQLRFRSRPEANPAPYFVDTGTLDAISTRMLGYEAYYRHKSWLAGSEYWFTRVNSRPDDQPVQPGDDPLMHGGDVMVSWLATGETRGYNTVGGFFKSVSPAKPVTAGGPGAWELVFRASRIDLDDGPTNGGRFWRLTPMVNWHLTDNVRLAFVYGYGRLNRFDLNGHTHFFQSRLQLLL
jgi:phosphate-selective porin OprO/OprP